MNTTRSHHKTLIIYLIEIFIQGFYVHTVTPCSLLSWSVCLSFPFSSVLLLSAFFLCLTFVVRIQMQSILTSPTGKVSPKHLPAATFLFHHSAACCCWRHPSVVCPSLSPPSPPLPSSLNLSLLPFSCPLHLSFHQSC